eukprot:g33658.t1
MATAATAVPTVAAAAVAAVLCRGTRGARQFLLLQRQADLEPPRLPLGLPLVSLGAISPPRPHQEEHFPNPFELNFRWLSYGELRALVQAEELGLNFSREVVVPLPNWSLAVRFMGVERHGTPNSVEHRRGIDQGMRERLQRIFYREREKDLLVTKYRDQCNSRGFRKRREAAEAREACWAYLGLVKVERPICPGGVRGTGIETSSQCHEPDVSYAENVTQPEDDAISYSAISAYTTSTPGPGGSSGRAGGSGAGGAARLPTPVKLGPLAVPAPSAVGLCRSARTPRSCSRDSGRSIGDAAYASTPLKAGAFDAINEDAGLSEPELEDEAGDERQGNSLEWSVLDSIAAELHKQDSGHRVEDEHFLEMEAERTKIWQLQNEQRRAEQQLKIEEMKQHRDRQVVLNKAKSAEEMSRKARRERAHQAFKESSEATRQRKAQADQLALLEQQQVEAMRSGGERARLQKQHYAGGGWVKERVPMWAASPCMWCLWARNAVFVSHQWASFEHPDPRFHQLCVLQQTLTYLLRTNLSVKSNLATYVVLKHGAKISSAEWRAKPLLIWYDYFSIPQLDNLSASVSVDEMGSDLQKAVESIPSYLRRCKFFVILAPAVEHVDTGELLSKHTWSERGWPAGLGSFTVDKDRDTVLKVTKEMLHTKLWSFLAQEDLHSYRMLLNMQHVHLQKEVSGRRDPEKTPVSSSPADHLNDFMEENAFKGVTDRQFGWRSTPLLCSLITCAFDASAVLIAASADVGIRNAKGKSAMELAKEVAAPQAILEGLSGRAEACCKYITDSVADKLWVSF